MNGSRPKNSDTPIRTARVANSIQRDARTFCHSLIIAARSQITRKFSSGVARATHPLRHADRISLCGVYFKVRANTNIWVCSKCETAARLINWPPIESDVFILRYGERTHSHKFALTLTAWRGMNNSRWWPITENVRKNTLRQVINCWWWMKTTSPECVAGTRIRHICHDY